MSPGAHAVVASCTRGESGGCSMLLYLEGNWVGGGAFGEVCLTRWKGSEVGRARVHERGKRGGWSMPV